MQKSARNKLFTLSDDDRIRLKDVRSNCERRSLLVQQQQRTAEARLESDPDKPRPARNDLTLAALKGTAGGSSEAEETSASPLESERRTPSPMIATAGCDRVVEAVLTLEEEKAPPPKL